MKLARMRTVRWIRLAQAVAFGGALGTLLSGCLFGENRQFFSTLDQVLPGASNPGLPGQGGGGVTTGLPEPGPLPENPVPTPSAIPPQPSLVRDSFRVPRPGAPKIDVLFCVDNSASMADNQRILAESFGRFIQEFSAGGLDYHIGLVTSDVDSTRSSVWRTRLPAYPGANRGRLLSRYQADRFLTNGTSQIVPKFQENVQVGTAGSSREQCLASFLYATDSSITGSGGYNEGFFRRDSLLAFVVVSDENEDIQDGESIQNRVARLRSRVEALSGPESRGARFDFIINTGISAPASAPGPGEVQYYPSRYLAASQILAGRNYDIGRNFSADLLAISQGMVRQASVEFTLSQRPADASGLVVSVDGTVVPVGTQGGYLYHPERNTIELTGPLAATAIEKELRVEYEAGN
jgi:hypothetical protein